MPFTRICQNCGQEFETKPNRKRKYCSMACYKKPIPAKICPQCGKEFKGDHTRTKYCSAKCSYNAKIKIKEKKCPHCSKKFRKSTKYCCANCYHQSKIGKPSGRERQIKKLVCETCGDTFAVYPSQIKHGNPRFCSDNCFYKWLNGSERAPRINLRCKACGKKMRVLKSRYDAGQGRFCSQSCINTGREHPDRVEKVECKCRYCGKTFYRYPSQFTRDSDGRFCSRKCVISDTNARIRSISPTSIEIAIWNELNIRNIRFMKEYSVGQWLIDIAFPTHRLAVEADGVYWHSLPHVIEKDKRKNADLKKRGWTVLHFSEDEIRQDVSKCVDQIVVHLNS